MLGGCSAVVKTKSAKMCLNFNLRGAGRRGEFCSIQNSKSQDLPKFQFPGGSISGGGAAGNLLISIQKEDKYTNFIKIGRIKKHKYYGHLKNCDR